MSTRPQIKPNPVITNGNMASNITSTPTILSNVTCASYSLSWTGTAPVGTASVQASNDYSLNAEGQVLNAGTWNTLTLEYGGAAVTTIPVTGSPGSLFIDIEKTGAYAIRLVYTSTSGTGTLNALVVGKV